MTHHPGTTHLAFDLGASSGRAVLGTMEHGKLILKEVHRFSNFPRQTPDGLTWDLQAILREIKIGLQNAVAAVDRIESFSLDTWGVDVVFFRDGVPLRDPYCYRDPRTESIAKKVHAQIPMPTLYARTGIRPMEINTLYQLLAHKTSHPEDFADGSFFLFMPDALLYLLTGEARTETTIASTGELLNPATREWDFRLITELDLPPSVFPPLTPPCTPCAPLSETIAKELGIPRLNAIRCASHDTASAVLAVPATRKDGPFAYLSCGTWALLGTELEEPRCTHDAFDSQYTNEIGVSGSIRFLTNIIGTWLLQETRRNWNETGNPIRFEDMSRLAAGVKNNPFRMDVDDPRFLRPCDMPRRIADFCREHGQGEIPNDAHLLRCIYDSLSERIGTKFRELEQLLGSRFKTLHILGGASRDELLMQLISDQCRVPVSAGPVEATAVGNILAQRIAAGSCESLDEARRIVRESFPIPTYFPRP